MSGQSFAVGEGKPIQIDSGVAHAARVYDYLLGGLDNFPADREVAERMGEALGGLDLLRRYARANRAFLVRTVRYLVDEAGVRQFLDVGTGVPNADNTRAVAQALAPDARVVSVDNDPMVLAHAHALLRSTPEGATGYFYGDLRNPETILQGVSDTLDLERPVALMLVAVLHLVGADAEPHRLVAHLRDRLAPGSYLVISHLGSDIQPDESAAGAGVINAMAREEFTLRTRAEIARFFDGWELLEPGLIQVEQWRSDLGGRPAGADPAPGPPAPYHAAVACKL